MMGSFKVVNDSGDSNYDQPLVLGRHPGLAAKMKRREKKILGEGLAARSLDIAARTDSGI